LCPPQPGEHTEVPLAQADLFPNLLSTAADDGLGGLEGTQEITAVDGVESGILEVGGESLGLGPATAIEGDLQVPLDSTFEVPVGLAVANEDDVRGHFRDLVGTFTSARLADGSLLVRPVANR